MPASVLKPDQDGAPKLPAARAFGQTASDLDLDFNRSDRPAFVSDLIALCCVPDEASPARHSEAAWELPIGQRIARLLRIVSLSTGSDSLPLTLRCPLDDCGQPFETALHFADLLENTPEETGGQVIQFSTGETTQLTLRLPTGRDQASWQKQAYRTAREATEAIVRSLVADSDTSTEVVAKHIEPLAIAMEEAEPLVAFRVATQCPNCSRPVEIAVDLEQAALQKLSALRRSLLRDIHTLATAYGWSENEVLSISAQRRLEYIHMIEEEKGELS